MRCNFRPEEKWCLSFLLPYKENNQNLVTIQRFVSTIKRINLIFWSKFTQENISKASGIQDWLHSTGNTVAELQWQFNLLILDSWMGTGLSSEPIPNFSLWAVLETCSIYFINWFTLCYHLTFTQTVSLSAPAPPAPRLQKTNVHCFCLHAVF